MRKARQYRRQPVFAGAGQVNVLFSRLKADAQRLGHSGILQQAHALQDASPARLTAAISILGSLRSGDMDADLNKVAL